MLAILTLYMENHHLLYRCNAAILKIVSAQQYLQCALETLNPNDRHISLGST